jgi:uncharacterized protein (TIGR02145 family)
MIRRLTFFALIQCSILLCQTQVAVADFNGLGISQNETQALTNRLMIQLHRTNKFIVLEREMLDKIIEEQKFQLSGCNNDQCLVELGQLANVQQIVGGSISKVGDVYSISARLISVESGEVIQSALFDHDGKIGELMKTGMADIAAQLAGLPTTTTNSPTNFSTDSGETVTDIDGNVYNTVKIGNQVWMAENLKVTHYQNGDIITSGHSADEWKSLMVGSYCNYSDDLKNVETYGRLYNWHAVADIRNLAPEGWHVPNDEEWLELEKYLGMSSSVLTSSEIGMFERGTNEGEILKNGKAWIGHNGTNLVGFSALPAGRRSSVKYDNIGQGAYFWTSTEDNLPWFEAADHRWVVSSRKTIGRAPMAKTWGLSIRCIKD